jgi:hypothetical protein
MKRKDAPSDLQLPKRAMATSEIRSVPNLPYRTISHALHRPLTLKEYMWGLLQEVFNEHVANPSQRLKKTQ